MVTCTRIIGFDAGHRLLNHESKCANLHGHRYSAEITCAPADDKLDEVGRVVDFSAIKEIVGGWIDEYWDHTMILNEIDPARNLGVMQEKDIFSFPCNPTAENLAEYLFYVAGCLLRDKGILVVYLKLWETPNCFAEYRGERTDIFGTSRMCTHARASALKYREKHSPKKAK